MQLQTLISDIYALVQKKDGWFTDLLAQNLSTDISRSLQEQLSVMRGPPTLRLSQMGPKCPCALWHSIHKPELAEQLPPWAIIKYSYGHILEALVLTLAKAAGHTVVGEQDELFVDDIRGHRDCVIDGCVVDVKSTSSRGFDKFKSGSIKDNDDFGYLSQLDGYVVGSKKDPLVTVKDKGYLLAIDKTLGHMVLYEHVIKEEHLRTRIRHYKGIVGLSDAPRCECGTEPHQGSGNIKLDTRASYSPYKHSCFPKLRTFIYANGPVYLTTVVRKPDVIEVDKNNKVVYN